MAPVTGWMLILLSGGLVVHSRWPASRAARRFAFCAVASLVGLGLLVWAPRLIGLQTSVELWLAPTTYTEEGVPVGLMSPLTGLTILLAALAFLLELQPFSRHRLSRWTAPALALGALLVSVAVLLSYLAALPLLYGSRAIPMALPTAAALFLLSCGILTAAGARARPPCLPATGLIESAATRPRSSALGRWGLLLSLVVMLGNRRVRLHQAAEPGCTADSRERSIDHRRLEGRPDRQLVARAPL